MPTKRLSFSDIRISTKIAGLMAALGLICIGVAVAGGMQLTRADAQYSVLTRQKGPALVALAGAERANYQMAYGMAMVVVYPGGSPEGRAWARSVTECLHTGEMFLAQAAKGMPEHRREISALQAQLQANKAALDGVVELALLGQGADATTALTSIDPRLVAYGMATRRVIDRAVMEQRDAAAALAVKSARTRWLLLLVSILTPGSRSEERSG